ncbi:dihydrofolate reductase, partial [Lactiplantibacillus plantarum]
RFDGDTWMPAVDYTRWQHASHQLGTVDERYQ